MSYPEFRELILEALKGIVAENISVKLVAVDKINSHTRHGVLFEHRDVDYAPTIYLEPFYESFQKGDTIEALAEEVYRCFAEDTVPVPDLLQFFEDYELAKQNIFVKMIHMEENMQLLSEIPHICFLDFALVPYLEVNQEKIYKGSILLKRELIDFWQVEEAALLEHAISNTRACKGVLLCPMRTLMAGSMMQNVVTVPGPIDVAGGMKADRTEQGMLVVTNKEKHLGAMVLYFADVQRFLSKRLGGDYYLLPSSVHEWIAVPPSMVSDRNYLFSVVAEANETVVLKEEILSKYIYYYSASLQKIYVYIQRNAKND